LAYTIRGLLGTDEVLISVRIILAISHFETPLVKLTSCLSLLLMLGIISAILNAIVKGRDY
ncbi:hypothetical protein, partial [Levilactobacillus humaensis]|uniref:hypothetical protein n=1 Tax=Levilactobacillus humaensis TaxID=2950375 RepID=UPI0021C4C38B